MEGGRRRRGPLKPPRRRGGAGRGSWDLVDQYNGLVDVGAHDQFGNPIAGLTNYTVSVAVAQTAALTGIAPVDARRIDITVTNPAAGSVSVTGYRANF